MINIGLVRLFKKTEIKRELNLINPRKVTKSNRIPHKLVKSTKNICSETLKIIFNNYLIEAEFPNELKLADITPTSTKEDPSRAENYRLAKVLPSTAQKMNFFVKDLFSKCDQNPQIAVDLVTFTEEILNEKLHFLSMAVPQKSLKESYTGRYVQMLISFYHLLCVAVEKVLLHYKHYCH